jgi:hypothetical protein
MTTKPILHAVPRPTPGVPVVSYNVIMNSHFAATPYEVAIVVRAADPSQAIETLDKVFDAVEAQLIAAKTNGWVPRG